ncbi:MAG: tetratricopeptide repeat protein [Prevotella sp.]|nr:tetratricopeptide repeat protein [Prevotellaceae bacterium]MDY5249895.1 tetratricopeptide repeat protein [Prevotella sp.]
MNKRGFSALAACLISISTLAQFNTDRLLTIGRSALYYEDYVLSIQYFNQAISAKPYLYEPWFFRAVAKYYLDDYLGTEGDCNEALSRNPYVANIYELRGLARIQLKKFHEATDDYTMALKYDPENRSLWHNRILCRIQDKDYEAATADLDSLLSRWKTYSPGYQMRAEILMHQNDTANAIVALDKALDIDPYDGKAWAVRASLSIDKEQWKESEQYLDKAIHYMPKDASLYINRALVRLKQNNLRGGMADYDMALDIDPNNFLGHYNRGLLRAQVGDDNRAIEDFDFVLNLEPENIMALFNRALLLDKTGELRAAIRDYTKVINEFPNFWIGLQHRAACYRRLGMIKAAEKDEFKVYEAQLNKRLFGKQPRLNKEQMRKKSDIDLDKYNQLVVADEENNGPDYSSKYRGRVQNNKAEMDYMPMFELTYIKEENEVHPNINYDRIVDDYNRRNPQNRMYVSVSTANTYKDTANRFFVMADSLSERLDSYRSIDAHMADILLQRAVASMAVQNMEAADDDLSRCLAIDSCNVMALWQRAACRQKTNLFNASLGTDIQLQSANVISDLSKAIELVPDNHYLLYNLGNVYVLVRNYPMAIDCYTRAIILDPSLAEAYFNRGLCHYHQGDAANAISDLSKAGELGLYTAYSILKGIVAEKGKSK